MASFLSVKSALRFGADLNMMGNSSNWVFILEQGMKHLLLILCSGFLFALPYPDKAFAQTLMDQAIAGSVGMGALYGATRTLNNSDDDAVRERLQQQGFTNIAAVSSSSSQYTAFVPNLGPVLLTVEPSTGQVLSVTPR